MLGGRRLKLADATRLALCKDAGGIDRSLSGKRDKGDIGDKGGIRSVVAVYYRPGPRVLWLIPA